MQNCGNAKCGVRPAHAPFKDAALRFWHDEEGATITEYILLVVLIGMTAVVLIRVMPRALRAYMGHILYVLSLPIP